MTTATKRAKTHLAQQGMIGGEKYSWHSRISRKSRKAQALLTSGTAGHDGRECGWLSRISTKRSRAKALLDDAAVLTRAVYQPRSAERKHIWHSRIFTAISKVKVHLAQQAMKGVYPYGDITNRQSENTTSPVVYQQRRAKPRPSGTTLPCRLERYIDRD